MLPWLNECSNAIAVQAPLSAGEQVLCLSPSGLIKNATILGALFSGTDAAPSGEAGERLIKIGGSSIRITDDGIILCSNGSRLTIDGAGIIHICTSIKVYTSSLNHNETDTGGTHNRSGVSPGTERTGGPK